ncbi:MAG: glycosyl hydrolase family 28-related protein [Pseudomonadota bacterium]
MLGFSGVVQAEERVRFPDDAGVINVTDPMWGVIPDDGVDDTAAIQRIFDLMTPSERIVYFPEGQYDISGEIFLAKKAFIADAAAVAAPGWELREEEGREFVVAIDSNDDPNLAPKLTFTFDAIEASRVLALSFRILGETGNRFAIRINGGEWSVRGPRFDGNSAWRDGVIATGIQLQTGENVFELAALEPGLQIEQMRLSYLSNYLNNTIIQGEGKSRTIFKLADFAQNPDGSPFNGAVIRWEPGVAQFFRNAVRNLTIDVGAGNPEAVGLRFHGNNQATVKDVHLVGADGSGDVGLDLVHSGEIGPALFENISIDGFAIGIHSGWQQASRTFYNIALEDQREFGWVNEAASTVFIEEFVSLNAVPAFLNKGLRLVGDGQGRVVLIDGFFQGLPGAEEATAITNFGPSLYLRNVSTPGYGKAVDNNNQLPFRGYRGQDGIDGEYVREWWSHGAYPGEGGGLTRVFSDSPDASLRLSAKVTPATRLDRTDRWVGPHMFPITLPSGETSGIPNDGIDDTLSIQAALDSGAKTIYLPWGSWTLEGDLNVPESVQHFIGTEASMLSQDLGKTPKVIIGGNTRRALFIERLANYAFAGGVPEFQHASRRTLVFKNITGLKYRPTVAKPGTVFTNDTAGPAIKFQGGQRVYARQLNIEENTAEPNAELDAKIVNDGARIRVLGFKTEKPGVHVKTTGRGISEILGNLHANAFSSATPQYITEDASLSVVTNIQPVVDAGSAYGTFVETRDGETRTGEISGTGYVAYDERTLWQLQKEIIVDNDSETVNLVGDWNVVGSFPRGHIGEDFGYAPNTGERVAAEYSARIRRNGLYDVYVRWVADWGGQPHSRHERAAEVTVHHNDGETTTTVDQTVSSDGWVKLGQFRFDRTKNPELVVTVEGTTPGRTLIADGVMLDWQSK